MLLKKWTQQGEKNSYCSISKKQIKTSLPLDLKLSWAGSLLISLFINPHNGSSRHAYYQNNFINKLVPTPRTTTNTFQANSCLPLTFYWKYAYPNNLNSQFILHILKLVQRAHKYTSQMKRFIHWHHREIKFSKFLWRQWIGSFLESFCKGTSGLQWSLQILWWRRETSGGHRVYFKDLDFVPTPFPTCSVNLNVF